MKKNKAFKKKLYCQNGIHKKENIGMEELEIGNIRFIHSLLVYMSLPKSFYNEGEFGEGSNPIIYSFRKFNSSIFISC